MATSGIPEGLKTIRPFILVAKEHDIRDSTLSYFCRRYAVEIGVKMKNRPQDVTTYLIGLMDELEKQKTGLIAKGDEAVTNDIVASAHVENRAMSLFLYADTEDRKGVFNKAVVKSFHTASILFDVLQSFGELTEEVVQNRKYAKWKATYIHGCMKKGETPIPGPVGGDQGAIGGAGPSTSQQPGYPPAGANPPGAYPPPAGFNPSAAYPPAGTNPPGGYPAGGYPDPYPPPGAAVCPPPPQHPSSNQLAPGVPPGHHAPPSTPDQGGAYQSGMPGPSASGVQLQPQDFAKAQKLCKFAVSALQYEDVPTAIDNLEKAIRLLKTGKE